jgi:phage anti-repressor protein
MFKMKDLIELEFNNSLKVNCVLSRKLWTALGYTEKDYRFRKWVAQRLDDTMAEENVDFKPALLSAGENKGKLSNKIDYIITVDLAKEFCMLERTSIGKQIRKYFIQCESELLSKPKIVQRVKGDEASKFHKLVLEVAIDKRQTLEGKTDHRGYCINIAKTVNLLCFGIHEPDIRQHMTRSFELRLNEINADVARLAIKGITKPKDVYAALAPKYTKQIAEVL